MGASVSNVPLVFLEHVLLSSISGLVHAPTCTKAEQAIDCKNKHRAEITTLLGAIPGSSLLQTSGAPQRTILTIRHTQRLLPRPVLLEQFTENATAQGDRLGQQQIAATPGCGCLFHNENDFAAPAEAAEIFKNLQKSAEICKHRPKIPFSINV